jgi:hypothetical protein
MQQIARIRFGWGMRLEELTALPFAVAAAGRNRFSVVGKSPPLIKMQTTMQNYSGSTVAVSRSQKAEWLFQQEKASLVEA